MARELTYLRGVTTLRLAPERCDGCGRCAEVCPHAVLALSGRRAQVVARDRCMECGACQRNCAAGAIQVTTGVGCAAALIAAAASGAKSAPSCGCSGSGSGCCG